MWNINLPCGIGVVIYRIIHFTFYKDFFYFKLFLIQTRNCIIWSLSYVKHREPRKYLGRTGNYHSVLQHQNDPKNFIQHFILHKMKHHHFRAKRGNCFLNLIIYVRPSVLSVFFTPQTVDERNWKCWYTFSPHGPMIFFDIRPRMQLKWDWARII